MYTEIRVNEKYNNREYSYDLPSRLFRDFKIYLFGVIDDSTAYGIIQQIQYLEAIDSNRDIELYINSPGGSVSAGLAIYDCMNYVKNDISTICIGLAASMGSFILSSGAKEKRFALPNAEILIHQPLISGGIGGQATEIAIRAENILNTKERLNKILSKNTGKNFKQIENDTDRDNWMSAEQALEYGLIDKIIK